MLIICGSLSAITLVKVRSPGESTEPLNFQAESRPRRQDWAGEIVENGMFYFATRQLVLSGLLQGGRCGYVEIPAEYSVEIDSPFDLAFAEQVMYSTLLSTLTVLCCAGA